MIALTRLRRVRLLLAVASGLILAFAFAPYHAPFVAWLAMAMLVFVSLDARPAIAALCGALHAVAFYSVSLYWIYTVMRQYGGLEPPAAFGVLALMIVVLSGFTIAFTSAVAWISRRSLALACVAAPFLWVTCEFARHHMPAIGFPWNLLGYAVSDNLGLLQLVTVTGIYGLSFLVAGYGALSAWLLVVRSKRAFGAWLAVTAIVLPISLVGGEFVPPVTLPQRTARIVQANLPLGPYPANWMEKYAGVLDELERLSVQPPVAADGLESVPARHSTPALVIWPEVPAPFYLQDDRFAARARQIAAQAQSPLLLGHVEWKHGDGNTNQLFPHNSAALISPAGERLYSYDKIHLVAFGEYNPWPKLLWFAGTLTQEVSHFRPGVERDVGQLPAPSGSADASHGGGRFATLICYEIVFGNEVRQFVAGGAELLINISNDMWFGRTVAPDQHLAMARVRAAENRRWLLRATNNGRSVAVDPYGRMVARMPADARVARDMPFDFRSDRTIYSRFGDWLAWLGVLLSAVVLVAPLRSRRSEVRNREQT